VIADVGLDSQICDGFIWKRVRLPCLINRICCLSFAIALPQVASLEAIVLTAAAYDSANLHVEYLVNKKTVL
jgi:hypothetical protein